MLDIKFIRENFDAVVENIKNKNEKVDFQDFLDIEEKRRILIQESDKLKNERNQESRRIAELKKEGKPVDDIIAQMKLVSDKIKEYDEQLRNLEEQLNQIVYRIPNMLSPKVPIGYDERDNKVIRYWGEPQEQKLKKNHIEIANDLGIIDFERGAKVSGSGFAFYIGMGAKLERALHQFMIDYHTLKHNYTELWSPFLVNSASMFGTGQLPKMADDMYYTPVDDLYLIPTAEVPLTNYHRDDILQINELPKKICGYSPCFRRESGSYGKEVHGFLRVHQFNKVEMVNFTLPENSYAQLEVIVSEAEDILQALEIPYRVVLLCSGDTSFASAMTYDLEIWAAGEQKWLEVSSCSNFEDFQARRANIRFKRTPNSKPEFVHTLNGSGVATSRLYVSIIENNIQEDGSILIPGALQEYCGFDRIERNYIQKI
ncbi:MAG TPA: serine--tRNA ligase [Candidatus Kapabacteria bacterium]|jgi:seryl-tRNA synthetase|nr:serine--tRNA ligase [Candidatus Kapabacteria bacterium]